MKSLWTQHIPDKVDKDALRLTIQNSGRTLEALTYALKTKIKKPKTIDYDSPSWPYLRADIDGYNRALDEILDLINIDQKGKQ